MSISNKFRLVILLSGRGSNFRAIYDYIKKRELPIEISLVLCDQEKAPGIKYAEEYNIPTVIVKRSPKEITNKQFNEMLAIEAKKVNPDLVVLAGFMRVLSNEFISKFPTKIINIHPSLLPSFKGLHCQEQAIAAGVKFSGCSVHLVTEELDAGPLIAQGIVPVLPIDTASTLAARILKQEHKLFPAVIEAISKNEIHVVKDSNGKVILKNNAAFSCTDEDALLSIKTT